MTGEALAVLAALAYGLAGVMIVRGKAAARGDNGLFLSVVLTAFVSGVLWLGWGTAGAAGLLAADGLWALAVFALAGVLANVPGRQWMYRATERIGAVRAGLLRRLTPLFALPSAYLLLGELPGPATLAGGALVLAGVFVYMRPGALASAQLPMAGYVLGSLSALAYALAYAFRGLGLEHVPDAALGAFAGALAGAGAALVLAMLQKGARRGWRHITVDRTGRHWLTALLLSAGQLLQFFALKSAAVVTVAVLGALEVLFAALFVLLVTRCETVALGRLAAASVLALAGTALLIPG